MGSLVTISMAAIDPGIIVPFAGPTPPAGWLQCDGSAVSRTTFAALFAALGTTWGAGDGVTTFNLPDLRDRTPIGVSPGGLGSDRPTARTLGQHGGEEAHTLTTAELASHSHPITDPGHLHFPADLSNFVDDAGGRYSIAAGTDFNLGAISSTDTELTGISGTQNTGSDTPHNTMQPFAVITWIIKQ